MKYIGFQSIEWRKVALDLSELIQGKYVMSRNTTVACEY